MSTDRHVLDPTPGCDTDLIDVIGIQTLCLNHSVALELLYLLPILLQNRSNNFSLVQFSCKNYTLAEDRGNSSNGLVSSGLLDHSSVSFQIQEFLAFLC